MNYASILTNRGRACDEGQRAFIRKEEKDGGDMVSGASALGDIPFLFAAICHMHQIFVYFWRGRGVLCRFGEL
jgi:hypothetical protein